MATRTPKNWYFVLHLEERDRPSSGMQYQIQLLNAEGQAVACGYADDTTDSLQILGQPIPALVIEAARRQPIGKGDYVDEAGNSIPPF